MSNGFVSWTAVRVAVCIEPAFWFLLCALRQRRTADLSTGKDAALRVAVLLGR
jgi:hypothetical protein